MAFQIRIAVILVNWRGWRDTLVSLETLFAGNYSTFEAVVVDNDSGDDSVEHICAWARGVEAAATPEHLGEALRHRSVQGVIQHQVLYECDLGTATEPARLTVIKAARNGGFAAGNNLALKYLLRQNVYDYFWLLNNDAYPAPDALTYLVARAEANRNIGMVGSTLIFAGRPDTIQALGGAEYRRSTGAGRHIGAESPLAALSGVDAADVEHRMAYIVGASMLVSARFLERVGLMEERYFLYFEEIDWAERGKAEFKLGYAKDSLVYHKAGGSTQAASRRSVLASYYIARNRMIFTRRFHPEYASSVWRATLLDALRYAAKARWSEARGFARAVLETRRRPVAEELT
jgi:GT2 family glycosyltransferase